MAKPQGDRCCCPRSCYGITFWRIRFLIFKPDSLLYQTSFRLIALLIFDCECAEHFEDFHILSLNLLTFASDSNPDASNQEFDVFRSVPPSLAIQQKGYLIAI